MAVIQKQIKKLNVQNFLTFLNDANTGKNSQHVIDIKDGRIYTKVTNQAKEFIKYATADLEGIGGDFSDFTDSAYRFYMTDLEKIIKAFEIAKNLKKELVNVKVSCINVEDEGFIRIEKMWLEGQLKLQISARDGSSLFYYVSDEVWNRMNEATIVAEFDLDEDNITNLKKIFNYLALEDIKKQAEQSIFIRLTKDENKKDVIKFSEEDEKVFHLYHDNNVLFTDVSVSHFSFHAYILPLFDEKLYKICIKKYNEIFILVATPGGDSKKTIIIPLMDVANS